MKNKISDTLKRVLIVIGCLTFTVMVFFCGFLTARLSTDSDREIVDYILKMYKQYYYEESDDLIGDITNAILDRYSEYYTKEEYDVIKKASVGQHEGIGVTIDGNSRITKVSGNSPAYIGGVKVGGAICAVGYNPDEMQAVTETQTAFSLIADITPETDFYLKVIYPHYDGVNDIAITHQLRKRVYKETSVFYYDSDGEYSFVEEDGKMRLKFNGKAGEYSLTYDEKTAVIRLAGFSSLAKGLNGTAGQFKEVLNKFKADEKNRLILDLRGNGGGYMDVFTEISSSLIDCESGVKMPVAVAKYKDGKTTTYYSGVVNYKDYGFEKIIVLGDKNTASASEALIGAMLDYDSNNKVNVIVAKSSLNGNAVYKSYGKGIMQQTFVRSITGDALKLTVAKLYWPVSGISIHTTGVTPEISNKVIGESSENSAFYDALLLCK